MWSLLKILLLRLAMPAMNCSWHLPDTTVETGHASYGLFLALAKELRLASWGRLMWSLLKILLLRLAMPAMNCSWHLPDTTVETGHASYGLFLAPANDTAVETGSASYGLFL